MLNPNHLNAPDVQHPVRIREAAPRPTVQIAFSDGRIFEGPKGATIEDFIKVAYPDNDPPIIACMVNRQMRELTYHAYTDLEVEPITLAQSDGMRIYRRSLSLLLIAAAEELFPGIRIIIDYGLNFGAFYFEVSNHPPLTDDDLARLRARMQALVDADLPIAKQRVSLADAEAYFQAKGWDDKLRLLQTRRKDYLTLYTINDVKDYMQGYMVPSTGYLRWFDVATYGDGYILQYPRSTTYNTLRPPVDYPKLVAVFNEYRQWMEALDVYDVGKLNAILHSDRVRELILVSEALHEQRIAQIATLIATLRDRIRLVSIAGPSSSGKTTFSKRLAIQLRTNGLRLMTISLDDFIVNREDTPRDEEGDYDYESLYSLDLALFNDVMLRLMNGETVTMPRYNFLTGMREEGPTISVDRDYIFVIEGIHGLNPELVSQIPPERIFRIYVSALTQLNLDNHNRVPTTDTRLLRRIVRDAAHRGYTATETILRWPKVRRGEHTWIFPYQENADVMFNSALVYELAALKPLAEPLLLQIEPGKPAHREAKRILSFLQWFDPLPDTGLIPDNSILREFIGGSILRDYTP
ncbi:MAG: nucleoside kinase [Caldilineae bacterium]|nr:MAG: nucleoside kinase [Caldilineae bacterium]